MKTNRDKPLHTIILTYFNKKRMASHDLELPFLVFAWQFCTTTDKLPGKKDEKIRHIAKKYAAAAEKNGIDFSILLCIISVIFQ